MTQTTYEKFLKLYKLLVEYGNHYPKKHGSWIQFEFGETSLVCDSWSKAIWLMKNAKFDNPWTGFKREESQYFGLDFGNFECHVDDDMIDNAISNILLWVYDNEENE
jgi:hypothetical protein